MCSNAFYLMEKIMEKFLLTLVIIYLLVVAFLVITVVPLLGLLLFLIIFSFLFLMIYFRGRTKMNRPTSPSFRIGEPVYIKSILKNATITDRYNKDYWEVRLRNNKKDYFHYAELERIKMKYYAANIVEGLPSVIYNVSKKWEAQA